MSTQAYNHSEFVKCKDVETFAKICQFECKCGKILGRNKIFEILRRSRILTSGNLPGAGHEKRFLTLDKEYTQGDKIFNKTHIFIKPEAQEYISKRIIDYLENNCVCGSKKKKANRAISAVKSVVLLSNNEHKKVCCSSPLDMDRDQALEWLATLPDSIRNTSFFACELRKKWGIDD